MNIIRVLFCLSIILINPFGLDRGAIWSQPKILIVELICILNLFIISENFKNIIISKVWKIAAFLWGIFLFIGLLSTINSIFPVRSLFGQSTMKDGLLYWVLIATFTLSNALVLKLKPDIGRSQLQGLLIGGIILAFSIVPQVIDWRIDYTFTSYQLIKSNILKSTIFQGHQPIGFYSHRSYASFVLTAIGIITLVAYRNNLLNKKFLIFTSFIIISSLILCQTRASLIALIFSALYYLMQYKEIRKYKLQIISSILILIILIVGISATRKIEVLQKFNFDQQTIITKQLSSDRHWLWLMAQRGINKKPWLGWGFDGFGVAFPYSVHKKSIVKISSLENYSYTYQNQQGDIKQEKLPSTKVHNLILDTAVSVGIVGTIVYLLLIVFCLILVRKSPFSGLEAIAIAYLIYTFTWYECAQYTHIFWWSLSFFDFKSQRL